MVSRTKAPSRHHHLVSVGECPPPLPPSSRCCVTPGPRALPLQTALSYRLLMPSCAPLVSGPTLCLSGQRIPWIFVYYAMNVI